MHSRPALQCTRRVPYWYLTEGEQHTEEEGIFIICGEEQCIHLPVL